MIKYYYSCVSTEGRRNGFLGLIIISNSNTTQTQQVPNKLKHRSEECFQSGLHKHVEQLHLDTGQEKYTSHAVMVEQPVSSRSTLCAESTPFSTTGTKLYHRFCFYFHRSGSCNSAPHRWKHYSYSQRRGNDIKLFKTL